MKDCPYCKNKDCYDEWEELEYENAEDQTPEYGGELKPRPFDRCGFCECDGNYEPCLEEQRL